MSPRPPDPERPPRPRGIPGAVGGLPLPDPLASVVKQRLDELQAAVEGLLDVARLTNKSLKDLRDDVETLSAEVEDLSRKVDRIDDRTLHCHD